MVMNDKDIARGNFAMCCMVPAVINGSFWKSFPMQMGYMNAIKYAAEKNVLFVHAQVMNGANLRRPN